MSQFKPGDRVRHKMQKICSPDSKRFGVVQAVADNVRPLHGGPGNVLVLFREVREPFDSWDAWCDAESLELLD